MVGTTICVNLNNWGSAICTSVWTVGNGVVSDGLLGDGEERFAGAGGAGGRTDMGANGTVTSRNHMLAVLAGVSDSKETNLSLLAVEE